MNAHKTAIISDKASIANDVMIGPYSIIEEGVFIGQGCSIGPHVHIHKGTSMGSGCSVHTGVVIGDEPQDLGFKGGESFVKIGDRNVFREYVTVHRGTQEGTSTIIGNDNFFMAFSHVAHNCQVGNNVIIVNNALLAGHVKVADRAFISASCLIHQFVRIGTLGFMAGGVRINRDLPPYMMSDTDNTVSAYNLVGLRRAGFSAAARSEIKKAYHMIYRSGLNLGNALEEIEKTNPCAEVKLLVDFIKESKRGICFSRSNRADAEPGSEAEQ